MAKRTKEVSTLLFPEDIAWLKVSAEELGLSVSKFIGVLVRQARTGARFPGAPAAPAVHFVEKPVSQFVSSAPRRVVVDEETEAFHEDDALDAPLDEAADFDVDPDEILARAQERIETEGPPVRSSQVKPNGVLRLNERRVDPRDKFVGAV